jgi:hypothetical protein
MRAVIHPSEPCGDRASQVMVDAIENLIIKRRNLCIKRQYQHNMDDAVCQEADVARADASRAPRY